MLIINELDKPLHFCEIHDFWRKIFKFRILRVKMGVGCWVLVDVFRGAGRREWLTGAFCRPLFLQFVQALSLLAFGNDLAINNLEFLVELRAGAFPALIYTTTCAL